MYVDDTDIFFSGTPSMTQKQFPENFKARAKDKGNTVVSTDGNINIAKSHANVCVQDPSSGCYWKVSKSKLSIKQITVP